MDRTFLGWQGRFFLHDVSPAASDPMIGLRISKVAHFHVIHHFFPKMPFCESFAFIPNTIEITMG